MELYPKPAGLFCLHRAGNHWEWFSSSCNGSFASPAPLSPRASSSPSHVCSRRGSAWASVGFLLLQVNASYLAIFLCARPVHQDSFCLASLAGVGTSDIQELQQLSREALRAWAEAGFMVCWCIRRSVVGCLTPLQGSWAQGAEQGVQSLLQFSLCL